MEHKRSVARIRSPSRSLVLDDTAVNRGDWLAALTTRDGGLVWDPSWGHSELLIFRPQLFVSHARVTMWRRRKTDGRKRTWYAGDINLISSILTGVTKPCPADKVGSSLRPLQKFSKVSKIGYWAGNTRLWRGRSDLSYLTSGGCRLTVSRRLRTPTTRTFEEGVNH